MNFIMRNLGWLLLAGFFVFMLFLISSNNTKNQSGTLSGVISTNSGEKNLDTLVEKLDDVETLTGNINVEVGTQSGAPQEGKKLSLFERFFGKKKLETNNDTITQEQKKIIEGDEKNEKDETSPEVVGIPETTTLEITKPENPPVGNLVKDTIVEPQITSKKPNTTNQFSQSSKILDGKIGDIYKVAVKSLRLNNVHFSKTLGYLAQGDSLKQIGDQNSSGCFQAEILSASNQNNRGKVGYVCQKYLVSSSIQDLGIGVDEIIPVIGKNTTTEDIMLPDISGYPKTQIGDIIILEKSGMIILKEFTDLAAGDKVDQMTNVDARGCFIAHVYYSSLHTSKDMVGKICLQDIYK